MSDPDQAPPVVLCQCGCGTALPPLNRLGDPSRFAHGHNRRNPSVPAHQRRVRKAAASRIPQQPLTVPCACGCGTMLPALNKLGQPSTWAKGHHNRGKKLSDEQRQKKSAARIAYHDRIGRKDPTWRRHKDPRYREWRLAVLERDAWTCQECGHVGRPNEKGFAAHHILPYATHPEARYDVGNGQTLCRGCHMRLHGLSCKPRSMRLCACGCGTLMRSHDRYGQERRYVNHHHSRGRIWTEQQRQKISAAKKGKKMSAEFCAKVSARLKSKPVPPQMLAASVAATTGKPNPNVARRNKERVWTDEMRAKLSASRTGQRVSEQARAKMSRSRKGVPKSAEHRAHIAAAKKGSGTRRSAGNDAGSEHATAP